MEAALAHQPAADNGPGPDRQPLQLAQREGGSACPATEGPRPEAQQVTGQQPSLDAAAAMVVSESEHEDDLGPPAAPQAALQAGSEAAGAAAADGHTLAGAAVGELAPPAAAAEAEAQPQGRGGGLKPAWKRRKAEREMEQARFVGRGAWGARFMGKGMWVTILARADCAGGRAKARASLPEACLAALQRTTLRDLRLAILLRLQLFLSCPRKLSCI